MNESIKFESKISNFEYINPLFSKVKIQLAYEGINRNNSYISKETFEKALPSIYNCPIVGEYNESIDDFRGHGGKIEVTDDNIKWINTTIPYGVIDSNTEVTWEEITEEDGRVNKYVCVTGYLWTGRYPELESVIKNSKSHSMEIEIQSGQYTEIDGKKHYEITDFIYSGFCILGDDISPCFESSKIMAYTLNKDKFKQEFSQMVKELKFSLQQSASIPGVDIKKYSKGGKKVDKISDILKKYNTSLDDLISKGINYKEYSLEDLENKIKNSTFSWSSEQLEDELRRIVKQKKIRDDWGYEYPKCYYVDHLHDEKIVIVFDREECYYIGCSFSINGDVVTIDMENGVRYKAEWVEMKVTPEMEDEKEMTMPVEMSEDMMEGKKMEMQKQFDQEKENLVSKSSEQYSKLDSEFKQLNVKYSELEEKANKLDFELTEKVKKEREEAESKIFESFSNELSDEEIAGIKAEKDSFTLDQLEEKLFALVGKKKAKFSLNNEKGVRVSIPIDNKPKSDKEYADIIAKYTNK